MAQQAKRSTALVMAELEPTVTNVTVIPFDYSKQALEALDEAIVDAYTNAGRHWLASRAEVIRRVLPGLEEMARRLNDPVDGAKVAELLALPKPTMSAYCRSRGMRADTVRQWRARYGAMRQVEQLLLPEGKPGAAKSRGSKRTKQDSIPESGAAVIANSAARFATQMLDPLRTQEDKANLAQQFARGVRECVESGSYDLPPERAGVIGLTSKLVNAILAVETTAEILVMASRLGDLLNCQQAGTDSAGPIARHEQGGISNPQTASESDAADESGPPPTPVNPEYQSGPYLITDDKCAAEARAVNLEKEAATSQERTPNVVRKGFKPLIIADGYEMQYMPDFLSQKRADALFARLREELPWEPEVVTMRGTSHVLTRKTVMYGVNYDYNPTAPSSKAWTSLMLELKSLVEASTGQAYEQAACNYYPDGGTGIGWHTDKKHPEMIASVSLGAARAFRLAPIGSATATYNIQLTHGSLLLIPRKVNDAYKHMVPESRRVTEARINITFRRFPG